jgi:hypothetical protein
MFNPVHSAAKILMVIICSVGLASCGDEDMTADGVEWLKANQEVPVNSGWKISEISAVGKGKMEIIVDLYSATAASKLRSLSAMDKGEVARLVCPIRGTEFWEIVGTKATVVVKLTSMGNTEVTAICRR